jgi:hypothetical protein
MMGKGQPRILEWSVKQAPFSGIGVLRFDVGATEAAAGPQNIENAAIVDLDANTVVAIVVERRGDKVAKWTWGEGKLVVASADGLTDEFELRKPKPPVAAAPPPRRYATEPWSRRSKPKSFFELLFKF